MTFKTVMIGYADPDTVTREYRWSKFDPKAEFQVLVMELDLENGEEDAKPDQVAEWAFEASNSPATFLAGAVAQMQSEMRAKPLRSLSVGDYVEYDGVRLACERDGWLHVLVYRP